MSNEKRKYDFDLKDVIDRHHDPVVRFLAKRIKDLEERIGSVEAVVPERP